MTVWGSMLMYLLLSRWNTGRGVLHTTSSTVVDTVYVPSISSFIMHSYARRRARGGGPTQNCLILKK